jgi:poly(ADP-ribose) glycohydrolase
MEKLTIDEEGKIESYLSDSTLLTDFANEFIGGGAANFGNVQEEIIFAIFPELFVSQLFCARMEQHEAIYIKGEKQYSNYSGYGGSLDYLPMNSDGSKPLGKDSKQRLCSTFVAIDASIHNGNLPG